ncbi:replication initiation factor domain-containing protein, partial [Burkholderia sp. SIMBA_024]|uniref:replication initiation factor domain-containing protein n=1 Tax=Burkholderia sp. SIMBA_024 TaxID=3085768 RepID=UPI00397CCAE1
MEKIATKDGSHQGATAYFGSPKSKTMIRFYEKHFERVAEGVEVDKSVTYWLRTEVQLRDENAASAMYAIINHDDLDTVVLG